MRPAILLLLPCALIAQRPVTSGRDTAAFRGVYEVRLEAERTSDEVQTTFKAPFSVIFDAPDGTTTAVEGYFAGDNTYVARAYANRIGTWNWSSKSEINELDRRSGSFGVVDSDLPGKLRIHPDDSRQFAFDDGSWFLHLGDTGYRYVVDTEPFWRDYIDQAAQMGATKIRTWFARSRNNVEALLTPDRTDFDRDYWNEIDRRILYAFEEYPRIQLQLIPYAEDTEELKRYGVGDEAAKAIAREAQARWSALPNVQWTISNDREIVDGKELTGRRVDASTIDVIGRDMAAREPWDTLLTNHQSRFKGYSFVDSGWSDIITLEDLDQVHGKVVLEHREKGDDPVVFDEDRYDSYRNPGNSRYFFRRLMWGVLLSGGHPTYGGLRTYEAFDGGPLRGVQGYFTANERGVLSQGAHDFRHIHEFFADSGLTLVGFKPADAACGDDPLRFKCAEDGDNWIVYSANPTGEKPVSDNPATERTPIQVQLPSGDWRVTWFDPDRGDWYEGENASGGEDRRFTPPETLRGAASADWVLLLRKL